MCYSAGATNLVFCDVNFLSTWVALLWTVHACSSCVSSWRRLTPGACMSTGPASLYSSHLHLSITCHYAYACTLFMSYVKVAIVSRFVLGLAFWWHPMSDLLHDVRRPISDQRSLRHGACTKTTKWGTIWVWSLREEVYSEKQPDQAPVHCTWCWWRQDLPVWHLLSSVQSQTSSKGPS